MTDRLWILGASDPEMEAIESLLRECGERVAHALHNGDRVTPATAYRATAVRYATDCGVANTPGETWYLVECEVEAPACARRVVIDHHRPGDPGFGLPPSEFLAASSLGQVIAELARLGRLPESWLTAGDPSDGRPAVGEIVQWAGGSYWVVGTDDLDDDPITLGRIPADLVITAAADHCLGAAYRGECPGVDPDALMRWRVESRARFQGREPDSILADIARAREALRCAHRVDLAMCCDGADEHHPNSEWWCGHCGRRWAYVRDLRDCLVPELPDAASRDGEAYLATVSVDGSGRPCRPKIVLGGATTPEMVRAFLEHWAPAHGLVDCYGDPERGFAGGYLPGEAQ